MKSTSGCCGITLRHGAILLLIFNIVLVCLEVQFSLMYFKELGMETIFANKHGMSMAYIFMLIEISVYFKAAISAFKRQSSMLTFATVILLLKSYFTIDFAVRAHYENTLCNIWKKTIQPGIMGMLHGEYEKYFENNENLMHKIFIITFYSMCFLIFVLVLFSASVVNSYKKQIDFIHMENMFLRVKNARNLPTGFTRPTSYVYQALDQSTIHQDKRFE